MTEQIKQRLSDLPGELFIAREQEYEAFKAHRDVKRTLEEEEALLLQRRPPLGKNAEQRKRTAALALGQDENILHYRNMLRATADTLADRKREVKQLEDEFSSLRNLVTIVASENILTAAGTPRPASAGVNLAINRTLGHPF